MFDKIAHFYKTKGFYAWSLTVFILLVIFSESGIIYQFRNMSRLREVEAQVQEYKLKIKAIEKERREKFGTKEAIETFAREQHFMKKPSETVIVIVDENNQSVEKPDEE
jgi:cell division protein FtsB